MAAILEATTETFAVGDAITMVGLVGAAELNGRAGVVITPPGAADGRYGVKLSKRGAAEPSRKLAAKPANLARRAPDAAPAYGAAAGGAVSSARLLATPSPLAAARAAEPPGPAEPPLPAEVAAAVWNAAGALRVAMDDARS